MNKSVIIGFLLLTPSLALASGSEVLSLLWLQVLVFIIVLVSIFLAKFSVKQKLVVFCVYLATAIIAFTATSDMPYLNNMYLINTIDTAAPLIAWLAIYAYYLKKQKQKHNKSLNQIGAKNAPPG